MQCFKPENYFEVRKALQEAGRQDRIGSGCDALIPAQGVVNLRLTGRTACKTVLPHPSCED